MANVDQLLAALRGEPAPQAAPPEALPAPAPAGAPSEEVNALKVKIEELERRLGGLAAPVPPLALEEPAPAEPPPPPPPEPPTELALFLQTRLELLERKLELAQHEALRSNLVLREREEAQRKAQREVEELFHSMREQQRSLAFDRSLREQYSAAQERIQALETRLAFSELSMVPAEEVLRAFASEEARAALEARLRDLAQRAREGGSIEGGKPAPPAPELCPPAAGAAPAAPLADADARSWALALGRIADLEARLELAERRREEERKARFSWETDILQSLKSARSQWLKAGGPELLVEAALESMVDSLKARDGLRLELERVMAAIRDEPPESPEVAALRARLAELERAMDEAQARLDQQMAVVTAWIERSRARGDG